MNEKDIRLNVISLDFGNELGMEEDDQEEHPIVSPHIETPQQQKNKELLVQITEGISNGAVFPAHVAMQVFQQFSKREVMARTKYRGNLDISEDLNL